ncbi:MAG TPA: hypothetical protein VFS43_00125 [Polyangiaceae bacterium]|nr:hypothetical protein [Polyangiaceae bacterium]
MFFDGIEFAREEGPLSLPPALRRELNRLASEASGRHVPPEETETRLAAANLAHFVWSTAGRSRRLVAYALNELYEVELGGEKRAANFFSSAFIAKEIRWKFSLYQFLGSLRTTGDEAYLFVRTQSPLMISFFYRFCKLSGYQFFSPLSQRVPLDVTQLVAGRFGAEGLVLKGAYGRRASMAPIAARSTQASKILGKLDVAAGDACVLVGRKLEHERAARALPGAAGFGIPKPPRALPAGALPLGAGSRL